MDMLSQMRTFLRNVTNAYVTPTPSKKIYFVLSCNPSIQTKRNLLIPKILFMRQSDHYSGSYRSFSVDN